MKSSIESAAKLAGIICASFILSCESPLDLDTERIESRIPATDDTPALRIADFDVVIEVAGFFPQGPTSWGFVPSVSDFSVDLASVPPTFSIDYRLEADAGGSGSTLTLETVRIRLEEMPLDGAVYGISGFPGAGEGFFASGELTLGSPPATPFTTDPSVIGAVSYSGTGVFNYAEAPSPELTGSISVSLPLPQNTNATVDISFVAREE